MSIVNPEHAIDQNPSGRTFGRRFRAAIVAGLLLSGNACSNGEDDSFSGGCDKFRVYAQNRWAPLGAAVRAEPDVLSEKLKPSFAGNEVIAVNGWIETDEPVYPTNSPPWDSDVWFHLANRKGWVSFPGVRGVPTSPDPSGFAEDGGQPAPTIPECKGEYIP